MNRYQKYRYFTLWTIIYVISLFYISKTIFAEETAPNTVITIENIKQPKVLVDKITQRNDPVSLYLWNIFSPQTRHLLKQDAESDTVGQITLDRLINEFNHLITTEELYDSARFSQVGLSAETSKMLHKASEEDEIVRLNYLLLLDAYPETLIGETVQPMDITADSLEYNRENNLVIASKHVRLVKGNERLRCDHAIVNPKTEDVAAQGNVIFERGNNSWTGNELHYNFRTQRGDFGKFNAFLDPFYITAKTSKRVSADKYEFENAEVTTCEKKPAVAYISAKRLWMIPGDEVAGQHVFLHLGGIPVMYSPYWRENIGSHNFFCVTPGCSKRMYGFLLTAFNYRLNRLLEASTHIDYRMRRGLGLGQDLLWASGGDPKCLSTERYMEDSDDLWDFSSESSDDDDTIEDKWY
jgi:lipopolysaccharide export system protein LptA